MSGCVPNMNECSVMPPVCACAYATVLTHWHHHSYCNFYLGYRCNFPGYVFFSV